MIPSHPASPEIGSTMSTATPAPTAIAALASKIAAAKEENKAMSRKVNEACQSQAFTVASRNATLKRQMVSCSSAEFQARAADLALSSFGKDAESIKGIRKEVRALIK